jgi:hypothetical protein
MTPTNASLHHAILSDLVDRGCAPSVQVLAERFGVSREEISRAMRDLADYHGVVLHPNSDEVWVIHPFSTAPTGFVCEAGGKQWWGNCAWCSLGVAKLVCGTCSIRTTLGLTGSQRTIRIENGELLDKNYVVHFPIPMTKAWDNVVYTCSVMLLFESEADVDAWCATHCKPKGDVRPLEQIWRFASEWYGRHLDRDWKKWTAEEAAAIFARHGLTGPIWEIPVSKGRF